MVMKVNSNPVEQEGSAKPETEGTLEERLRKDPLSRLDAITWFQAACLVSASTHGIKELASPLSD